MTYITISATFVCLSLLLLLSVLLFSVGHTQFGNLKEKIKQKIDERVNKKTDPTIDKTLDKAEGAASANNSTTNNNKDATARTAPSFLSPF